MNEELYESERRFIDKLIKTENEPPTKELREYKSAVKRTIERLNREMKQVDDE